MFSSNIRKKSAQVIGSSSSSGSPKSILNIPSGLVAFTRAGWPPLVSAHFLISSWSVVVTAALIRLLLHVFWSAKHARRPSVPNAADRNKSFLLLLEDTEEPIFDIGRSK